MRMPNFQPALGQRLYAPGRPIFTTDSPPRSRPDSDQKAKAEPERLRIFAAFAHVAWGKDNLQSALEELGEVIPFHWNFHDQDNRDWHDAGKARMNREMMETLLAAHREKPLDVFFGCLSGRTVFPGFIRAINLLGIRTLNISLNDKDNFIGALEATGHTGMIDIASAFSLNWTNREEALAHYESAGARILYLPIGANPQVYRHLETPRDIDVSFVGRCDDRRAEIVDALRQQGITVETFGKGWPSGKIPVEETIRIYSRSRINLGFANGADAQESFRLKGRDFEVPMSGGLYFTQYHRELGDVYEIGREIVCYHNPDDLAEKMKFYFSHPDKAEEVRLAGHRRAINEHTWSRRCRQAFLALGVNVAGSIPGISLLKTRKPRRILLRATAHERQY